MRPIKKILFPTDFSENASNAFEHAKGITEKSGGELALLHVYDVPIAAPLQVVIDEYETMESIAKDMQREALSKMDELLENEDDASYEISKSAKSGEAEDVILDVAKENELDLVVMGTKGVTADRGLFMSSMTKSIVQKSYCPVLAIPEQAQYRQIKKIVYATDLKHEEAPIIDYLVQFAKLYDAEVILLHVDNFEDTKQWSLEMLRNLKDQTNYDKIFYREVVVNDVIGGINDFADEYQVDLLAMTTMTSSLFDKLFHRSITKEVLLHTNLPLLVFNRKTNNIS
ncbi:MAG: universal stress protein [Bacteroidota bacterium]